MKRQLLIALAFVGAFTLTPTLRPMFGSCVEARPARSGDVSVSITLREDVAALAWIDATDPGVSSPAERHDAITIFDDAGLEDARVYLGKLPKDSNVYVKTPTGIAVEFGRIPDTATVRSLSKGEAELLVAWLAPSKAHPQNLGFGRILAGLADKVTAAIGKK